jgi:hypothetical protein
LILELYNDAVSTSYDIVESNEIVGMKEF